MNVQIQTHGGYSALTIILELPFLYIKKGAVIIPHMIGTETKLPILIQFLFLFMAVTEMTD